MQIFVKTLTGKNETLNVTANESVASVMEKICGVTGIASEYQRLIF